MMRHAGLGHPPLFSPSVGRFYRGMLVEIAPGFMGAARQAVHAGDIHAALAKAYAGRPLVEVANLEEAASLKTLDAELMAGSNRMKLFCFLERKRRSGAAGGGA